MKTTAKIVAAACTVSFVVSLGGCAQFAPQKSESNRWTKQGQRPSSNATALLYYADYLRNLNATDYVQEVERARLQYATEKTDFRLLQYAVALSMPGGDLGKAQEVMDPLFRDSKVDPELNVFAAWLRAELVERSRLEAETKRALAEAKRAEVGAKRADELGKKVEEMRNIEKNLIQRDTLGKDKP